MNRMKRLIAVMLLAAVASFGAPAAYAGDGPTEVPGIASSGPTSGPTEVPGIVAGGSTEGPTEVPGITTMVTLYLSILL